MCGEFLSRRINLQKPSVSRCAGRESFVRWPSKAVDRATCRSSTALEGHRTENLCVCSLVIWFVACSIRSILLIRPVSVSLPNSCCSPSGQVPTSPESAVYARSYACITKYIGNVSRLFRSPKKCGVASLRLSTDVTCVIGYFIRTLTPRRGLSASAVLSSSKLSMGLACRTSAHRRTCVSR